MNKIQKEKWDQKKKGKKGKKGKKRKKKLNILPPVSVTSVSEPRYMFFYIIFTFLILTLARWEVEAVKAASSNPTTPDQTRQPTNQSANTKPLRGENIKSQ